jgi:hypothetical protein
VYYVRRYTGFNLYEETYNASGGYVSDDWEAHATVFTAVPQGLPDPLRAVGPKQSGVAAYGELRLAKISAVAAQLRLAVGEAQTRVQGGAIGKLWLEKAKLLFLGEADVIRQQLSTPSYGQTQFVSYVGLNVFPTRGVMSSLSYERFQENVAVSGTGRNAFDWQVNFFPWAHCEFLFLARYQLNGNGAVTNGASASLAMLQFHYYL